MQDGVRFAYLNLDLSWPGVSLVDLETGPEGELTLARVPSVVAELKAHPGLDGGTAPGTDTGPAGIATTGDCACDVYISDPARHVIWHYDACVGDAVLFRCLTGPLPGQFRAPRGLAIVDTAVGPRLYVADSGNHRIQVVDLGTQQPLTAWGQPDPYATPTPGAESGRLNDPWDLAADADGNLYVVDHGNARVQKFTGRGQVVSSFWDTISAEPVHPLQPIRVAVGGSAGGERVYMLDSGEQPRVFVYDVNGTPSTPAIWEIVGLADATALAATDQAVYVGGGDGTILKLDLAGQMTGWLVTPVRPVAALTRAPAGELLAGSGGASVVRLGIDGGYQPAGYFRAGPFETHAHPLAWHRWRVLADPLSGGSHVQLFTYASTSPVDPPTAAGDNPFDAPGWSAQPRDELDVLVLNDWVRAALAAGPPGDPTADQDEGTLQTSYFWLGGLVRGDGSSSPTLRQVRIDYSPATYLRYLPAVYQEGRRRRLFLELALSLLQSELGRAEDLVAGLPALFDPAAAPPDWLPWLASWLDFDLVEDWPPADARRHIAEALDCYLKLYAGVDARIEEPNADVALFALDDSVALGYNTVLAPAHEQGAVLASTATLGQSHLLPAEEIGIPLFEDVSHRFCVQVYAAQIDSPRTLDLVRLVADREKPAHTEYHVCVIQPRMQVGFQARLGIDTIVAGAVPDMRLGEPSELGADTVLADQPRRSSRIGLGTRVGGTL
jgi:phage tail-like protein